MTNPWEPTPEEIANRRSGGAVGRWFAEGFTPGKQYEAYVSPQKDPITQAAKTPQPGQTTAPTPTGKKSDGGLGIAPPKGVIDAALQDSVKQAQASRIADETGVADTSGTKVQPPSFAGANAVMQRLGIEAQRDPKADLNSRSQEISPGRFQRDHSTPWGTMSGVTSAPPGRGTVSAPDQGNGGTVEGNVAAIERQIEAVRSLREAHNPGILAREAGTAPPSLRDMVEAADPFAGRTYLLDSMDAGQRAQANALRTASAAKATDQYGAMERERTQGQATQNAARVTAQQRAQEAAGRLGIDAGRLALDSRKASGDAEYNALLKAAQSRKLAGEARQKSHANQILEHLIRSVMDDETLKPDQRADALYKLGLLAHGKAEPIDPIEIFGAR